MSNRVLVVYATKYGATAEIADKIGQVLREGGLEVVVRPAEAAHDFSPFQAVVIGSAVYAGNWRKEAAELLEQHEKFLAQHPTWLFSSGPTGDGDPVETMKGWRFPVALQPLADRIRPRDIAFFHGEIDNQKLNFAEKLLVKGIKAPLGDFRDWNAITAWAKSILAVLRPEAVVEH